MRPRWRSLDTWIIITKLVCSFFKKLTSNLSISPPCREQHVRQAVSLLRREIRISMVLSSSKTLWEPFLQNRSVVIITLSPRPSKSVDSSGARKHIRPARTQAVLSPKQRPGRELAWVAESWGCLQVIKQMVQRRCSSGSRQCPSPFERVGEQSTRLFWIIKIDYNFWRAQMLRVINCQ